MWTSVTACLLYSPCLSTSVCVSLFVCLSNPFSFYIFSLVVPVSSLHFCPHLNVSISALGSEIFCLCHSLSLTHTPQCVGWLFSPTTTHNFRTNVTRHLFLNSYSRNESIDKLKDWSICLVSFRADCCSFPRPERWQRDLRCHLFSQLTAPAQHKGLRERQRERIIRLSIQG